MGRTFKQNLLPRPSCHVLSRCFLVMKVPLIKEITFNSYWRVKCVPRRKDKQSRMSVHWRLGNCSPRTSYQTNILLAFSWPFDNFTNEMKRTLQLDQNGHPGFVASQFSQSRLFACVIHGISLYSFSVKLVCREGVSVTPMKRWLLKLNERRSFDVFTLSTLFMLMP